MDKPWTNRGHDLRDVPAFRGSPGVSLRAYYVGPYGSGTPPTGSVPAVAPCLPRWSSSPESPLPLPGPAASPRWGRHPRGAKKVCLSAVHASRLTRPPLRFGTSPLPRFAPRGASRASAVRFRSPTPAQDSEFHAGRSNEGRDPFPSFSSRFLFGAGPLRGRAAG